MIVLGRANTGESCRVKDMIGRTSCAGFSSEVEEGVRRAGAVISSIGIRQVVRTDTLESGGIPDMICGTSYAFFGEVVPDGRADTRDALIFVVKEWMT